MSSLRDIPEEIIQWGAGVLAATVTVVGKLFHGRLSRVEEMQVQILQQMNRHELNRVQQNPTNDQMTKALEPLHHSINTLHEKMESLNDTMIEYIGRGTRRK